MAETVLLFKGSMITYVSSLHSCDGEKLPLLESKGDLRGILLSLPTPENQSTLSHEPPLQAHFVYHHACDAATTSLPVTAQGVI